MILTILKNLQKELTILLIGIAISTVLILFTYNLRESAFENKQAAASDLKQARDKYYTALSQKRLLEQFEKHYIHLQKTAIVGEENRLSWIDSLENIAKQNKIPYLKYKIEKRQKVISNKIAQAYPGIDLYKSIMSLQLQLLHEGDLYTMLDSLNQQSNGLFDIQRCSIIRNPTQQASLIHSKTDKNFNANCILNWYSINRISTPVILEEDI